MEALRAAATNKTPILHRLVATLESEGRGRGIDCELADERRVHGYKATAFER